MGALIEDVKYGIRMLGKSPGFAAVAMLTLALGIGGNTAMFSFVNAWVIHPLSYPHSEKLVVLVEENTKTGGTQNQIEPANFFDIQHESQDFEEMCLWTSWNFNLTGDGPPERVNGSRVGWNFFHMLGATPALGRTFLSQEDEPGAGHVVILSRGLWNTRYGGDPNIIGRSIQLGGESYTVVGVMPAKFQLPLAGETNIWVPLALSQEERAERRIASLWGMGRLREGVTTAQAQGEVAGIASQLEKTYPATNTTTGYLVHTLKDEIGQSQGNQEVLICFWIVGLVLLIACANVANLMLARATGRTKELAVRTALGAGRGRLVRQLLTETVLLFLGGSVAGVGMAYWTLAWIEAGIPAKIRGYLVNYGDVQLDVGTLFYTFGVAFVAGIVFGLAPAISSTKLDVFSMLKEASGRVAGNRQGTRLRKAFVIAEIALAVVIVICAALLAQSFTGMIHAAPGFRPDNVMVAQLDLPESKYKSPAEIRNFYEQVMNRVRALPEKESAGMSEYVPFGECCASREIYAVGKPAPPPGQVPWAHYSAVTPDYFSTMQIDLVKGRYFTSEDTPTSAPTVIINRTLAKYFWPNEDPIGHQLRFTRGKEITATIVGVVDDVELYNSMSGHHPREMYVPFAQEPSGNAGIVVRSRADHTAVANAIRDAVWSVDSAEPVSLVQPLQSLMDEQHAGLNITVQLMVLFASLALFLGAIGIYAVMAFNVAQRTHEFGIRLALGARPAEVLRLVLGSALRLAGIGIGLGLVIALAAARFLGSLLLNVTPHDPLTFGGTAVVLAGVALAACYLPARRAMRVDPIVALRYE